MALNFGFSTMCGVIIAAENGSVEQRSSGELSGGAKAVIRFLKILGLFPKVYFTITHFWGIGCQVIMLNTELLLK